jgi:hypothetical protein
MKGEFYAVDNLHGSNSAVAVRYGYFLYHGRPDSYTARDCNYYGAAEGYSRAEGSIKRENQHGTVHKTGGTLIRPVSFLSRYSDIL